MIRAFSRSGALAVALTLLATPALSQDFFSDLFGGFGGGRASRSWGSERGDWGRAERRPRVRRIEKPKLVAPKPATAPAAGEQAKTGPDTPPAPYDAQTQRLAEILGGLSYLRDLCGDGDGADWRAKLATLRDADTPSGSRRAKLTAAFNRGFSGYELTYHSCTPNAKLVIARYLQEAQQVASSVATRYATP
ncbi:TIGR02301 family protein [Methylocystis bryophila]|uniref:TIGR02301 family protein n=1 Tax=Methylocystis bryophila TaxID=655015 RepID=UPI000A271EE7|nr:TIGR02301 family protein [Methylocystis bryophila]BDV38983.1 hypothetical protein DSM21852_22360 [Methylocystis bryophila]